MERAHEEGLRPVDVVLTSAQNKHAIKEVVKIRRRTGVKDAMSMSDSEINVGKSTALSMLLSRKLVDQERHHNITFQGQRLDRTEIP